MADAAASTHADAAPNLGETAAEGASEQAAPSKAEASKKQDVGPSHGQGTMTVKIDHLRKPGEVGLQESDLLDRMPIPNTEEIDKGTEHIRLVSLGCFCGPKLSFKKIGRGAESLPFDWMRTRVSGLLHFMREDFDGFFDFVTKKPVPNTGSMIMYRGYYHSFWHDDPTDPAMHERYGRRLIRFKNIDAHTMPVLFVRAVACSDELNQSVELLEELKARFGSLACLCLLIDFQTTAQGAALVNGHPNLIVHFLSNSIHNNSDGAPYGDAVKVAVSWAAGRPIAAMQFVDMETIIKCTDPTEWGLEGLGGFDSFESQPPAPRPKKLVAGEAGVPLESDLLEMGNGQKPLEPPPDDGLILCSLGCFCGPKLTFQKMGRGAETLPFDWMRVSFEGLLHFLSSDFDGFFDYTTKKSVPGASMTMYRSRLHSFWHDNPESQETKDKYGRRIARFKNLGASQRPILFVRVAATTDEILRADELLSALRSFFGELAALLLIADFQHTNKGLHVVDDREDLLVSLHPSTAHNGDNGAAPYVEPVQAAIDWVNGEPLEAACLPDLESLCQLIDENHWGLVGLGDLDAFEDIPRRAVPSTQAMLSAQAAPIVKEVQPLVVPLASGSVPASAFEALDNDIAEVAGGGPELNSEQLLTTLKGSDRADHLPGLARLDQLDANSKPIFFVRIASSIDEILIAPDILAAAAPRDSNAFLLMIVDRQTQLRLFSVEGHDNILLAFVYGDCRTVPQRCCEPCRLGVHWVLSRPLQVSVVNSFGAVRGLCAMDQSYGPGGASVRALANRMDTHDDGSASTASTDQPLMERAPIEKKKAKKARRASSSNTCAGGLVKAMKRLLCLDVA